MITPFRDWSIKAKIVLILLVCVFLFDVIAVKRIIDPQTEIYIMNERQSGTQHVVEVAYKILESYAQRAQAGEMSSDEAKRRALSLIKPLRFGGNEYFWIHDLSTPFPRMIMHSTIPSLDGTMLDAPQFNVATSKRTLSEPAFEKVASRNLFVVMNEVAETAGEGFVSYLWPKPIAGNGVTTELYPKISFVKKYAPWGWVVGSGVYVDDVKVSVAHVRRLIHASSIFFCFAAIIIYLLLIRYISKPLNHLAFQANRIAGGDYSIQFHISTHDEVGMLSESLNQMMNRMHQKTLDLEAANNRFRTLVDTIPDLIWLKDVDGIYLCCNKMFERVFGTCEADIVGKTDYDFVDREQADGLRDHDRKAMTAGGTVSKEEWVIYIDDGQKALIEKIKTPMYDGEGKLVGVLGIGHDITKRKMAEEEKGKLESQFQQAQKMESVGRLAGGVAHDFNNMLTVILGHAQLALMESGLPQSQHERLMSIQSAATKSADLTRQLLAFARKQTIAPVGLDLNKAVSEILKMLQRLIGEDIHLTWLPVENLWPVKVDPSQIDQILANLCVNARDAITDVGKITIETGNRTFDAGYCAAHLGFLPGDYVQLAVSDNGCGMDKSTVAHIFEPFFTTKESGKGTGLGLATVYGIVKQNNGFINVYSEPGLGTTFTIYLSRYEGEADQRLGGKVTQPVPIGQETILLVEDEMAILTLTTQMLEKLGYTVIAASGPGEALSLVQEQSDRIDLLMTDVVMPEMNGLNLAKNLQSHYPNLKCLFMSGYTTNVIAHHGVLDEGVNFIQKPFSVAELATKVHEVLAK
ncbi:MAG: cache domain-containing protein [Desulfuromonadaceae bacterium]|nr:cache domain-containing protein [Desulfuromonadaceae bacterium]MDD5106886.1 cache domain-containing protein [Desulfuromonadaceae bacterium]